MTATLEQTDRPVGQAMRRGFGRRCPRCGTGGLFSGYLTVRHACDVCGQPFYGHRADDAPPYLTILIVAHIIVPAMIVYERMAHPPLWHQMVIGIGTTIALSLYLLPRLKGALIGIQWAKRMHGFDDEAAKTIGT